MTLAFSLLDVSRVYPNGTKALDGFSLDVIQGERVSLIGPSGCGKSTALRLLAGLDAASAGTVQRDSATEIGYVFQDATLLPWASVFDNVYLPFKLQGVSREKAKPEIDAMLERLEAEQGAGPSIVFE